MVTLTGHCEEGKSPPINLFKLIYYFYSQALPQKNPTVIMEARYAPHAWPCHKEITLNDCPMLSDGEVHAAEISLGTQIKTRGLARHKPS